MIRRTIRVKPGSSRNAAAGRYPLPEGDALIVAVSAPAVDGKANSAVAAVLAKALGLKTREVEIVSGHTARTKIVELPDTCESVFEQLLLG
jgi:uncharacterized protein (TIGR00251 family)